MTAIPLLLISLASAGAAPQGVLIDFMSNSCGPCMQMSPIVEKLHAEGLPVKQVNVDQNPQLARQFNITLIPAFVVVVNGQEVNRIEGKTSESQLRRLIAQIPTVPETQLASATQSKSASTKSGKASEKKSVGVATVDDKKGFSIPLISGLTKKKAKTNVIVERDAVEDPFAQGDNESARQKKSSEAPLASSVRIRVNDKAGVNFGSGTIIDSKPGRTVVLTCGHIFRSIENGATVEVDVYRDGQKETFPGSVMKYNLKAEVGLVSFESDKEFSIAKVAGANSVPVPGDRVTSVGCSGGDNPTTESIDITRLNRYEAPDNIECTGLPVQGRSGGGLFNGAGEVVGVCFAADPNENRGLYCGLQPIHELLDKCGLASLYENASPNEQPAHAAVASTRGERSAAIQEVSARTDFAEQEEVAQANSTEMAEAQASLDGSDDSEVVCIIRPRNNPESASRVVIINRASPKFVHFLQGELRSQTQQTMARVPHSEEKYERKQKKTTHKDAEDELESQRAKQPLRPAVMRVANRPAGDTPAEQTAEAPHRYKRSADSLSR